MEITDSTQIKGIVDSLLRQQGLKSVSDLGRLYEEAIGESGINRQSSYNKGAKLYNDPSKKDLLMLAGLFGVPYEKLKNADPSLLNTQTAIGDNNTQLNNSVNAPLQHGDPYMDKIFAMDIPDGDRVGLLHAYFESKK